MACWSSIEMRSDTLFSYCCLGAGNIISTLTNKHNGTVFFLLYKGKSIGHLDRGTLRRKYVELNFTPKQQQQHCTWTVCLWSFGCVKEQRSVINRSSPVGMSGELKHQWNAAAVHKKLMCLFISHLNSASVWLLQVM